MRWLDFGARNRLSDKGCHPFYEFPYDSAKICSFSLFAKPVLINFKKVYQNGYSIFKFSHFVYCWFIFHISVMSSTLSKAQTLHDIMQI